MIRKQTVSLILIVTLALTFLVGPALGKNAGSTYAGAIPAEFASIHPEGATPADRQTPMYGSLSTEQAPNTYPFDSRRSDADESRPLVGGFSTRNEIALCLCHCFGRAETV
jgi:hypothetical protein